MASFGLCWSFHPAKLQPCLFVECHCHCRPNENAELCQSSLLPETDHCCQGGAVGLCKVYILHVLIIWQYYIIMIDLCRLLFILHCIVLYTILQSHKSNINIVLSRLHGMIIGGAMKVGNMRVFETILRRSLGCSQQLDGHSTGKANNAIFI